MHQKLNNTKHRTQKSKYIKRLPLRFKVLAYLSSICIFTVSLLWIFQVFLLDDFYYHITLANIKESVATYSGLDDSMLSGHTTSTSADTTASIIVANSKGEILARSNAHPNNIIGHFGTEMIQNIYQKAKSNGGEYIHTFDFSDIAISRPPVEIDKNGKDKKEATVKPSENSTEFEQETSLIQAQISAQRLVYSKIVLSSSGADRIILYDCSLTPVGSIVDTIKFQLIIISILCILLCIVITLLFSYRITRPIARINESAKSLAKGRYDVKFEGGGCREIDELSDTLSYASEELSKLESLQNELISNISHDLRTPLTMINGYAEVMRDIPGENTPDNVQIIIDETKRLTSLVNNLLEISKMQQEAKILNPERFNLSELIRETTARFEKLNENKGYSIAFDLSEEAFVLADKEKISQVLYNLIGNAINYTGIDKKVFIRQTVAESIVKIEVCDTGEGIEPDKLPQIWHRYYRADKFHKRSELGMGIGLSIVKDILEAHNAAFGVTSKLGVGSVFWFKLHTIQ